MNPSVLENAVLLLLIAPLVLMVAMGFFGYKCDLKRFEFTAAVSAILTFAGQSCLNLFRIGQELTPFPISRLVVDSICIGHLLAFLAFLASSQEKGSVVSRWLTILLRTKPNPIPESLAKEKKQRR